MEDIIHLCTCRKGGDINYILSELLNFYDINTKNKFDSIKFIQNFYGILLKKFNINSTNIYIDFDLVIDETKEIGTYAYHYNDDIYLNPKIFKNNDFFYDLIVMTHEFFHIVQQNQEDNQIKKIGINSNYINFSFNENIAKKIGYEKEQELHFIYYANNREIEADNFAFNYILDLISLAEEITPKNTINFTLLNLHKEKIKNLDKYRSSKYQKICKNFLPNVIMHTKIFQKSLGLEIQKYVSNNIINFKFYSEEKQNEFIKKYFYLFNSLLDSFSVYENFNEIDKLKNFFVQNSNISPICLALFVECLNCSNYIVTKEDLTNLIEMFDAYNFPIMFDDLNLEKEDLKENIIKIKFNEFDKDFTEFENKLNQNIIEHNSLIKNYEKFKKIKNHKNINML